MKTFKLSDSSFVKSSDHPRVFVEGGKGPYQNTLNALRRVPLDSAKGKRVLLKPNVGRIASPKSGVTTDPNVVAAAIDAFRAAGAVEVAIGESPITGVKTLEAFEANGTARVATDKDCPLIDMDARRYIDVSIPKGRAIRSLKLCPELLEFDVVVSIPVMKTHMHTGVTLAVKNMKGCLWRRSKVDLHMLPPIEGCDEKPINVAITDMASVLTPHLSIIDGTVAMEGLGPSAGSPKKMDVVIVGADPFAADSVACELMGLAATDVPHLRLAAERGYGVIDLSLVNVSPDNWRDRRDPFDRPPTNLSVQFPNVTILDKNSCSACQSTLLLFLRRYGDQLFDYFPKDKPLTIAIGKGNEEVPEGTLCVGNCAAKHKGKGIFVPGCPPVGSKILGAISRKTVDDVMDGHSQTPPPPSN